ncbi:hypothetical protein E3T40_12380 [Cryobacterium sp. TMT1-19]|uniref:hypothetical protein n=1 Tax=unclassified Cryobacterium TaxID=2649013 RepID=UPI0010699869|nr:MULTISPECIES: hypothetical protein [unclassified Cryobacterium]TFD32630.1 hypothetical protein E3T40_12380 [Cryobacterium sp. TMT1-19]
MATGTLNTGALIKLVNVQLTNNGTEFVPAKETALGPFGTSVFGSIKGYPVRLDFAVNPASNLRAVLLFDLRTKELLAERLVSPTFEESIEAYPWTATIAALVLT